MIVVAGALNLDHVVRVPRIAGPGLTVLASAGPEPHPGGKGGNQAVAAARLDVPVRFFGAVGRDAAGALLLQGLRDEGVDTAGVREVDGPSGSAWVQVDDHGENAVCVVAGANQQAPLPPPQWPAPARWLLLQLELPLPTVLAWARAAHGAGAQVLLNAAPAGPFPGWLPPELLRCVDTLVANEAELTALCDGRPETAAAALGPPRVVMTLAGRGAVAWAGGRRIEQPAHDVWAVDTTGAGDTFSGALAAGLWHGQAFDVALQQAAFAASLACTRMGARGGMPDRALLLREMQQWRDDVAGPPHGV